MNCIVSFFMLATPLYPNSSHRRRKVSMSNYKVFLIAAVFVTPLLFYANWVDDDENKREKQNSRYLILILIISAVLYWLGGTSQLLGKMFNGFSRKRPRPHFNVGVAPLIPWNLIFFIVIYAMLGFFMHSWGALPIFSFCRFGKGRWGCNPSHLLTYLLCF